MHLKYILSPPQRNFTNGFIISFTILNVSLMFYCKVSPVIMMNANVQIVLQGVTHDSFCYSFSISKQKFYHNLFQVEKQ